MHWDISSNPNNKHQINHYQEGLEYLAKEKMMTIQLKISRVCLNCTGNIHITERIENGKDLLQRTVC